MDADTINGIRVAKAMERIAVINWMATEHEEKTLMCHNLKGDDLVQYNVIRSAKAIEQAAKCSTGLRPLQAEQEAIQDILEQYLNKYAVSEGKQAWLYDLENGSSSKLIGDQASLEASQPSSNFATDK